MKIALIDKHPVLRRGLDEILHTHFETATILESDSVIHFRESFPDLYPDMIIIGVGHVGDDKKMNPIIMTRKLYPKGNVIIYDETLNPSMISRYLKIGVSGYLSKDADLNELIECVKDVASGKRYLNSDALLWMLNTINFEKKIKFVTRKNIDLTLREREIAGYLADGMRTSWIAHKLGRKSSTISTIKYNIYKKLDVDNVLALRDVIKLESVGAH